MGVSNEKITVTATTRMMYFRLFVDIWLSIAVDAAPHCHLWRGRPNGQELGRPPKRRRGRAGWMRRLGRLGSTTVN